MSQPKLAVSFSGGETSGMMAHWIKENFSDKYEIKYLFANTGEESERTLRFVDQCDREWGLDVVWLEAVVQPELGDGTQHRIVNFDTASRSGEPFEQMIKKYGIPNQSYPHCTRELKLAPIRHYLSSIGWSGYTTAIGYRADEVDRMDPKFKERRMWYPLIKLGITKRDVRQWWRGQPFSLGLKEHQGNCKWCWKKSLRKHLTLLNEAPEHYDFPERMERQYGTAGHNIDGTPRVFFRENRSTKDLREMAAQPFVPFREGDEMQQQALFDLDLPSGGCGGHCEPFSFDEEAA